MNKSLRANPVDKLYTLSYGFFSNTEFFCNIREYSVKITAKTAKLSLSNGGFKNSVHKKSEEFLYDMEWVKWYYSSPEILLDRFKKAVELTKKERWKSWTPAKLECLDLMIQSLEKQVVMFSKK